MKKFLFLLAAVSLALSSCMKEDEYYNRVKPVLPGLNIYSGALTQNRISMQPANVVVRLGMLLAEAKAQGKAEDFDLTTLTTKDGKTNIFDKLFPKNTKIAKTEAGNYEFEFDASYLSYYTPKGKITVLTNNVPQLADTDADHPWSAALAPEFKVVLASASSSEQQEALLEGTTKVYEDGAGYRITLDYMQAYTKEVSSIKSNWNGWFKLIPPTGGESLAYEACAGKPFGFSGSAQGPTCITFDGRSSTYLTYVIESGSYMDYIQNLNGKETASLKAGNGDYNTSLYPSPEVEIEWATSAENRISETVTYGGVTVVI